MTSSALPLRRLVSGQGEHPLGVGCRPIGGPALDHGADVGWAPVCDGSAVEALLRAHDEGATVYATSDIYGLGHSQRLLGRMLAQVRRQDVRITCTIGSFKGTGLSGYSTLSLHGQVEQTLENLGVESLDVLTLAHTDFGPDDRYLDEAREILQALRDHQDVKAIGMRAPHRLTADFTAVGAGAQCQDSTPRFMHLFQQFGPEVLSVSVNPLSTPLPPEGTAGTGAEDIFSFARRQGVATMVYKPLGQGLLTGKYGPQTLFHPGDVRCRIAPATVETIHRGLQPLRERFGAEPQTLARIALQHCLRRYPDSVVLTGVSDTHQVISNFQGLTTELSDEDFEFVEAAYASLRDRIRRCPTAQISGPLPPRQAVR
ncbi:aldo/keto reductase [Streptomyces acidiscabies]|uniref:Aldo/keto reductase n=1 Tax=Streptomyces acidiscabies TaxID=42234 RepID=A0ABU4MAV1_9ACTN|nr:aldo/keto reductase [Streptomyces acidiscabies]MDX3024947.1 aldo/keto reductase [Streptomyces acidiscabies]